MLALQIYSTIRETSPNVRGPEGTRSGKVRVCEAGPLDPLPPSIRNSLKKDTPLLQRVQIFREICLLLQLVLLNITVKPQNQLIMLLYHLYLFYFFYLFTILFFFLGGGAR